MLVARALKNSQLTDGETQVSYGTGHLNQSRQDPAARDTSGFHFPPRLAVEAVDKFCLPPASGKACHAAGPAEAGASARQAVFDLIAGNARVEVKGNTRNLIYQKRDDRKRPVGLIGREESESGSGGDCFAEFNASHISW
jgi:hypothetical protein